MSVTTNNPAIDLALTHYFEGLDEGKRLDFAELCVTFPDCATDLEKFFADEQRLKNRLVEISSQSASRPTLDRPNSKPPSSKSKSSSGRLTIRCPNCHQPTQVATDTEFTDLTCQSCGSRFGLIGHEKATTTAAPLLTMGRFELVERLGMGAFGTVWKARDKELDRTVAVKIPRQGGMTAEEQEKFLREARAAAQLSHPNIVSVHEVGRDGDSIYIVSDFVRGLTLADWLTGQQPSGREAAELCAKVAEALHHAHEKGIVHRDLKPANIMLDGELAPHIMDFGLARREVGEVTMTMDGHVLGTPAYMSPEQAEGKAHAADRRSDVYSLGVILFQLLTGELPFRGNARMLMHQVIHDEPPSPRKLNANIKRDLETITLKCLEKDPAKRYQTSHEFAAELRRFLAGEPIQARPASRLERGWRWAKRKPAIATLSAAVVTLIAGTIVVLAASNARINRESTQKDEALQKLGLALTDKDAALLKVTQKERVAEERLESGLIAAGDAALALGEAEARDYYREALELERKLGVSELPAIAGLTSSYAKSPVPLIGNDGKATSLGFSDGTGGSRRLAICPNGRTIAIAGRGVTLWDIRTGVPQKTIVSSEQYYSTVAVSPDGTKIAAGSDGTLYLWDLESGKALRALSGHEGPIRALAFSPDSESIASASIDKTIRRWDVGSGEEVQQIIAPSYAVLAVFTPDGRQILGGGEGDFVTLWNIASGKAVRTFGKGSGYAMSAVAIAPDGRTALTGSVGHKLVHWDLQTGEKINDFVGHTSSVSEVAFSPDGKRALSVSTDRSIRIWDVATAHQVRIWIGHRDEILSCAVTPDWKSVITSDRAGEVKLWNLNSGQDVASMEGHTADVRNLSIAADGRTMLSGGFDRTIRLWDVATCQTLRKIRTGHGRIFGVALSHDGRSAASAHEDGHAFLWNPRTGERRFELTSASIRKNTVEFAPDDSTVLVGSNDIQLWNTSDGKLLRTLTGHRAGVRSTAYSPDGRSALSSSLDGTLILWDLITGDQIHTFNGHSHWVMSAAISADGLRAASGGWDHHIGIWDLSARKNLHFVRAATHAIESATFSPDGRLLLVGSLDGSLALWDISGSPRNRLIMNYDESITAASLSADGHTAFSATTKGLIQRWQLDCYTKYAEFGKLLSNAHRAIQTNSNDADALHVYAKWYQFRGVFDWAAEFFEKARTAGAEISNLELARCYWRLGRTDDAAREFRKAIERQEAPADYLALCLQTVGTKVDKQEAIARATVEYRQGNQKLHVGDHRAARLHYEEALDIRREVLGENHPDTATVSSDLGFVSLLLGDHSYAKECLERAIIVQKESIGTDDGRTAYTLASLCHVYRELSDFDKSMACCNEALAIRKKLFGDNRIETAWSLRDMAMLLVAMEEYSDALPYYEQAQAIQTRRLGELHPDFIATLREYAEASEQAGHREEAREQRKRADALEAESKSKIKSPARIREIVTRLAENGEFVQAVQQSVAGGEESFRLVIDATSDAKCLTAFEPKRIEGFNSAIIGEILIAAGKFTEAEKDLRRPLPNGRPFAHWHYMVLGRSLWGQGKEDEARKSFHTCLEAAPQQDSKIDLGHADIDHLTVAYFLDLISEEEFRKRSGTAPHQKCHVWYQIGQRNEAEGKVEKAVQAYQQCVKCACDPPHIFEAFANWRLHKLGADAK